MSLVKMAGVVALSAAMASQSTGFQAQQPSQVQSEPVPEQQVLDPVAPIPGDEWFGGYPVEPGTGQAVLCEDGQVVDYWPHQEWKKAQAPAECREQDAFSDELARRVSEFDSTDSKWVSD